MPIQFAGPDPQKAALIESRTESAHWARSDHGRGEIFRLPLISKLVLLTAVKFASLDPSGLGIQMEAGRPGWYDALNGLPALFGSSAAEAFELLRLIEFLAGILADTRREVELPAEGADLLRAIRSVLDGDLSDFEFVGPALGRSRSLPGGHPPGIRRRDRQNRAARSPFRICAGG